MAILILSTGIPVLVNLNEVTTRRIVEVGDGSVPTLTEGQQPPGMTLAEAQDYIDRTFYIVKLKDQTKDAAYGAATSRAPISLGIDNVLFRPLFYPEAADILAAEVPVLLQ
jgi:hypothetical protein